MKNKILGYVFLGLVFAGVVGAAYWWQYGQYKHIPSKCREDITGENCGLFNEPKIDETADWKTYRNEKYGFGLKYPRTWSLDENVDPDGYFVSNDLVKIAILPRGEFDYGLPTGGIKENSVFAGKNVIIESWKLQGGVDQFGARSPEGLIHYHFMDEIPGWIKCGQDFINCNRIDIAFAEEKDRQEALEVLSTFKFKK